ncbi:MFS transporter [Tepidibacillus fermentans]|uniref:YNFM family putative membrane transporter n=1 Tax=Tepidibacillus fermentans TaxID=1281767 RepID=A0A4R3K8Z1_9BACI|nr:MFS transporter [Tepidibacillus fermentans]TCS79410.1 YNFM family putative membrane transporter [Tepidibacillus fermentans]
MNQQNYISKNTKEFWKATVALSIGSFLIFSNLHMVQPLLPLFSEDFHVSPATASLTVSLVTLTLSIFLLLFGPISDAMGRKNIMSIGLFGSSFMSILIFFSPNFTTLLILRTFQGIFLASLPAIAYAYIGEEFDKNAIGIAIGIYISGNSIGGMGGRIVSGFIADHWGWQYSFLIMGIFGLLFFFLFLVLLPKSQHFQTHHFSLKIGIREMIHHWKNPILRQAYYVAGIIYFIFLGLFNYLGYYLHQSPYFLSTTVIGLLYISYLAGTFSSTLSGRLDQVLSIPRRIFYGLLIILVGILFMGLKPLFMIMTGLIFVVFGFFFVHSASSSWVSLHASHAKAGASSLYLLSYYMGGSMGGTLLGYVWSPFGWNGIILVTFVLVLVGIRISFRMNTFHEEKKETDNMVPSN